jgi:hypothetical protein
MRKDAEEKRRQEEERQRREQRTRAQRELNREAINSWRRNRIEVGQVTIYAPMIYTAPCIMFWDACIAIKRASERGLGPGIREFFGPCEMASSR